MTKGIGHDIYGSMKSFVEYTGISMVFQNRLLVIDRRGVSIMSGVFRAISERFGDIGKVPDFIEVVSVKELCQGVN
jgi:hypothetical protein